MVVINMACYNYNRLWRKFIKTINKITNIVSSSYSNTPFTEIHKSQLSFLLNSIYSTNHLLDSNFKDITFLKGTIKI